MIYEMRTYYCDARKAARGRAAVRETLPMRLFLKYGFRPVGYWTESIGDNTKFHYMLAWEDDADRRAKWADVPR